MGKILCLQYDHIGSDITPDAILYIYNISNDIIVYIYWFVG